LACMVITTCRGCGMQTYGTAWQRQGEHKYARVNMSSGSCTLCMRQPCSMTDPELQQVIISSM
jgi:hypothetical protein